MQLRLPAKHLSRKVHWVVLFLAIIHVASTLSNSILWIVNAGTRFVLPSVELGFDTTSSRLKVSKV